MDTNEHEGDDIKEIRVHYGERVAIELINPEEGDFFFLRDEEHARRFCETLQRLNPEIRVTEE